jgi:hypothetical protein
MIFRIEKVGTFNFFCNDNGKHGRLLNDYKEFNKNVKLYLKEIYLQKNPNVLDNKHDGGYKYFCPFRNCNQRFDKARFVQHMRRHVK